MNTKFLISSLLISSVILGSIVKAENDVVDPDFPGFHIIPQKMVYSGEDLERYAEMAMKYKKVTKKVAAGELIFKGDPSYNLKLAQMAAFKIAGTAWNIAEPLVIPVGIRMCGNVALSHFAPCFAGFAGKTAAAAASKASAGWTWLIPGADKVIRTSASKVASGEAYRQAGTLASYAEAYGPTAFTATKKLVSTTGRLVGSGMSTIYNRFFKKSMPVAEPIAA
ncbi:MAG: hypothetical protein ACD_16C00032G0001 [uncultured bacterium]|nr:MAG: hypothetical protein ACD_16C00032G0001 [uncultured bacterium]OFW68265.1 MAG: hypothetical protein A2X70_06475 [Alphaproteobacteria bacterium GWC2_42_16]OFW74757.1 MAG: hypothetical protein A2Z80_02745 [Alphaproteobacteria bacterium GWA2_41_27]OFW85059.1 MAG: hypothetical protein A3E50_05670 [Alphaproteobacteria bacterium RIFCSPHIGHO2_12_FULL_42_100]OFW85627.1 MAG: hypothetical protein A2W06_01645 [Alphaproteobacteria bacterium RBG_16_42_14]OFW92467.1 MAG: hypothetical protein A2W46_022